MTTAGPWSVKGIDPKAREIAKDLARRSGLTLGEWLNQMITDTGESDAPPPMDPWAEPPAPLARGPESPGSAADSFRSRLRDAGRAAEAAELARVTRALNDLSNRMEAAEHRSTLAISGIDQQVMGVLSRIEDGERDAAATAARVDGALGEVRSAQDQVAARLSHLAEEDAPRVEALKSLEGALARMASQIYEGEGRTRASVAEIRQDVAGVTRRMERVEQGGGGGQAGDAAFARIMERLDAAESRTSEAVRALEGSFAGLEARLKRAESSPDIEQRFSRLAADLQARVEDERHGMAARLRDAAEDPRLDRMERVLRDMSGQVATAEKRSADAIDRMGHEVMRIAQSLSGRMDRAESAGAAAADRMSGEVARIAEAVEARAQRGDDLQAQALERLGGEITRIAETLSDRIAESEQRSARAMQALGERLGRVGEEAPQSAAAAAEAGRDLWRPEPPAPPATDLYAREREADEAAPAVDGEPLDPFASLVAPESDGSRHRAALEDFAPGPQIEPETEPEELYAHFGADAPEPDEQPSTLPEARARSADPFETFPAFKFEAPELESASGREAYDPDDAMFAPPTPAPSADPFEAPPRSSTRELIEQARAAAREAAEAKPRRGGRTLSDLPPSAPAPLADAAPDRRGPFGLTLPRLRKREGGTLRSIAYASGVAVTITMAAVGAANLAGRTADDGAGEAPTAAPVETASTAPAAVAPGTSTLAMAVTAPVAPTPAADLGVVAPPPAPAPEQARTLYSSGVRRIESGDPAGVADLRKAANLGLPEAQFHLANLFEEGQAGLPKDSVQARTWMARAASGGDAKAMFNLGLFYANGEGGARDDRTAVSWFRRAADLGLHDAQFNLAVMNQDGRGAPQSAAEAYKWFLIAAASGDAGAQQSADALKAQIAPDALAAAQRSASAWKAARVDAPPTA